MLIINKTKNAALAENAFVADTFWKRIKGLLGRKSLKAGEALVIRPCNSVHTFFMRFPIDVLFVDKDNRIIKTVADLEPFRMTPVIFGSAFVVELPAGTLHSTNTRASDLLL